MTTTPTETTTTEENKNETNSTTQIIISTLLNDLTNGTLNETINETRDTNEIKIDDYVELVNHGQIRKLKVQTEIGPISNEISTKTLLVLFAIIIVLAAIILFLVFSNR